MELPVEKNRTELFATAYSKLNDPDSNAREVKESEKTVQGKAFLIKEYQIPWGEPYRQYQDYWWEKDSCLFLFSLNSGLGNSQEFQASAAQVLESFSVQSEFLLPTTQAPSSFELKDVSFKYPPGWEVKTKFSGPEAHDPELDARLLCRTFTQNPYRSLEVLQKDLPNGVGLEEVFQATYKRFEEPGVLVTEVSETTLSAGGQTALVKFYNRPRGEPWWRVEDVWLKVNGKILILSFTTYPEQFSQFQPEFEQVLSSLRLTPKPTETPNTPTALSTTSPSALETPSALEGSLLTARQAFALAEPKAKAYSTGVKFMVAFSGIRQTGEAILEEGTSLAWEFWFLVPGEKLIISVRQEAAIEVKNEAYQGSFYVPMPEGWIDSPLAIKRACEEFAKNHPDASEFPIADMGLLYQTVPIPGKGIWPRSPYICRDRSGILTP